MSEIKTPLITVTLIIAVIYVFAKLFGPIPLAINSTNTQKPDLFRVEGKGEQTVIPDTAQVMLGVTSTAATVEIAQANVNKVTAKVLSDLKALGVSEKDIKTTNYSIYPNEEVSKQSLKMDIEIPQVVERKPLASNYTATQNITVKVKPLEKANKIIDAATSDGANQIGGVTFTVDDEKRKVAEEKAREEAVKNAKEKAESLAKVAGIRLGKIADIQEYPDYGEPMYKTMASDSMAQATELPTGESTIRVSVTLGFETD